MNKKVSLLLLFVTMLNNQLNASGDFEGNGIFAKETIKLVAGDSFPPLMWNDKGVPRGVAIEVSKAILEKAGYKVIVETCPWAKCQLIAENEGAFVPVFSKTEDRLKKFIYSDVKMYDEVVIVTKKGKEFSYKKDNDLKGKRVGYQNGASFGPKFEDLKREFISETDNNDVVRVKKIMLHRLDAGFFSLGKIGFSYSVKLAGFKLSDFSILPDIIGKDPNYLATGIKTENTKEKMEKINKAVEALTKDGTIAKIMKKSFQDFEAPLP